MRVAVGWVYATADFSELISSYAPVISAGTFLDRGDYFVAVAASYGRWRVDGRESRRADTRVMSFGRVASGTDHDTGRHAVVRFIALRAKGRTVASLRALAR